MTEPLAVPEKKQVLIEVTWEETKVMTATFDVTDYHRNMGWDVAAVVSQCSPVVPDWQKPIFGSGVETHERSIEILHCKGRLPS